MTEQQNSNKRQQRLVNTIDALPNQLRPIIANLINKQFKGVITQAEFQDLIAKSQLTDKELRLALLPIAAVFSIAPISHFHVGAIAKGTSGALYFGANMEFIESPLSQSVHAEQSAISHAWLHGEKGITSITINHTPCGHCRQFMNELTTAETLLIQLPNSEEQSLSFYLPDSFGPQDLNIKQRLLGEHTNKLSLETNSLLLSQAAKAANLSHAPYSNNFCGVALEMNNGNIYHGMYAENAAFNPSLPPLQVALIHANMSRENFTEIKSVALIESSHSSISHLTITQNTLKAIAPDAHVEYLSL